jgi:prophage antirepressor-like protein
MNITPFQFDSYSLRVQTDEQGNPWFSASDVCAVLAYGNPRQAIGSHVDSEDVQKRDTLTAGGVQAINYINESGLYALIFGSTKPEAKRFKHWVTAEVLPSLRKNGSYAVPAATPAPTPVALTTEDKALSCLKSWLAAAELLSVPKSLAIVEAVKATDNTYHVDYTPLLQHSPEMDNITSNEVMLEPTELGKHFGYTGKIGAKMNLKLEELGLQVRNDSGEWEPTQKAEAICMRHLWKLGTKSGYNTKWNKVAVAQLIKQNEQV